MTPKAKASVAHAFCSFVFVLCAMKLLLPWSSVVALCGASLFHAMRDPHLSSRALVTPRQVNGTTRDTLPELIHERIERVSLDWQNLDDFYKVTSSPKRHARLRQFFKDELSSLEQAPFDEYDQEGKVDYLLIRNWLRLKASDLESGVARDQKVLEFLGGSFPLNLTLLIEARQEVDDMVGKTAATTLNTIQGQIAALQESIVNKNTTAEPTIALRATNTLAELRDHLKEWYEFYKDYDPLFTWWVAAPYPKIDTALGDLSDTIKKVVIGIDPEDEDTIIGEPIGRAAVLDALESEMIPYTPEELIEIGNKEYAWCENEMTKASNDLGFPHWQDALEHVKNLYVEPGQQPSLVRDLTDEAATYVKDHDLVTVPQVCEETIRTFMMTPERQKLNPFFLGGESIIVSYPTSTMQHPDKLMSLRGNNIHFARATVFHEMIPGHHLQGYYMDRIRSYRSIFQTPFSIEGWAFYWEMVLWDKDSWPKTPENRIGMLFWRMHRAARIIFSLKYHLGDMTPQEAVEFLVDKVQHERATAEGEVRRSVMGDYGPLYQAGYMLGALQLYNLRKELVDSGRLGEKAYHDRYLRANQMPIELLRALNIGQELSRDFKTQWRFYGNLTV